MTTAVRSPNRTCSKQCNSSAICTASPHAVNPFYSPFSTGILNLFWLIFKFESLQILKFDVLLSVNLQRQKAKQQNRPPVGVQDLLIHYRV
jgi:hypothetical protein